MKIVNKKLGYVFLGYWLLVFVLLVGTRFAVGASIDVRMVSVLGVIALIVSLLPCVGTYLKAKLFVYIYSLFQVMGILYMYVVILLDVTPGWSDITSLLNYFMITVIGFMVAIFSQVISTIMSKKEK